MMKARTVEMPATARGPTRMGLMSVSSLYGDHAGKAYERHGHEAYGDEGDARPLQPRGNGVVLVELRAYGCQEHYGEPPAGAAAETEHDGLNEIVIPDLHEEDDAEHGAVHRDEGEEDAQGQVEGGRETVDDHFEHLDDPGYHDDENDEGEVLDPQGLYDEVEDGPADGRADAYDHGDGHAQAHGALEVLGDRYEGTGSQEIREEHVAGEDARQEEGEDAYVGCVHFFCPPWLALAFQVFAPQRKMATRKKALGAITMMVQGVKPSPTSFMPRRLPNPRNSLMKA